MRRPQPGFVRALKPYAGDGAPLVFAHANGFPPDVYKPLLDKLARCYQVYIAEHRPLWQDVPPPAELRWPELAADLAQQIANAKLGPVTLVGHSLGAVLGLFAAECRPELFNKIVLVEPVFFHRSAVWCLEQIPWRFKRRMQMIKKTLNRPTVFETAEQAFRFHRRSRTLSCLDDQALQGYVDGGFADLGDRVVMRFPPTWEAHIYATVPNVWRAVRRVKVPVFGIRAENSNTLSSWLFRRWQRWRPDHVLVQVNDADHLLPLAQPDRLAKMLIELLRP